MQTARADVAEKRDSLWLTGFASMLLVLVTIGFFEPIVAYMMGEEDYPVHLVFADTLWRTGVRSVPHFLYHQLIVAVHSLQPSASLATAALIVTVGAEVASALIVFFFIRSRLKEPGSTLRPGALGLALVLTVAVLLAGPVLLTATTGMPIYLIGYFPPNAYHSPTTILAKPFALGLFAFVVQAFDSRDRARLMPLIGAAIIVVLSALAKPSYLIALLPAVGMYGWFEWRRNRQVNGPVLVAGLLIPAVLVLGSQYYMAFGRAAERAGVIVAPLRVIGFLDTKDPVVLLFKLLASVLFPLVVTVAFWTRAKETTELKLSWLVFACGGFYAYMLAESGDRMYHGNFLWSAQLAVFVLFVAASIVLAREMLTRRLGEVATGVCWIALSLHIVGGIRHVLMKVPIDRWMVF